MWPSYSIPQSSKDALGDSAALVNRVVICELILQEGSDGVPALIADLRIRDVWLPQIVGVFFIRVTDSDTPSYMSCSATDVLVAAEEEKKYLTTAEA